MTAEGKNELVVVDPKAAKVLSRIPTGTRLSHMVTASPDGKRAYVSSLAGGVVTVIDLVDRQGRRGRPDRQGRRGPRRHARRTRDLGRQPRARTRSRSSTRRRSRSSSRSRRASSRSASRSRPTASAPSSTFTGSGDVGVYDVATRAEIKRIPIGRDAVAGRRRACSRSASARARRPSACSITPDGKRAFVSAAARRRRRGHRPREPARGGRLDRRQGARRPGGPLRREGRGDEGRPRPAAARVTRAEAELTAVEGDLDRLDLARALELEPALVGAGLGQAHEKRDPAVLADARLAVVRVGVREGLGVRWTSSRWPSAPSHGSRSRDRPPFGVGQRARSRRPCVPRRCLPPAARGRRASRGGGGAAQASRRDAGRRPADEDRRRENLRARVLRRDVGEDPVAARAAESGTSAGRVPGPRARGARARNRSRSSLTMKRCMSLSCWTSKSVTSRSSKLFARRTRSSSSTGSPATGRRGVAMTSRGRA